MEPSKPVYRNWPKKRDGDHYVVDKEKVRQQYLEFGQFDWRKFCEYHNYDPSPRKAEEFPLRAWREEWKQHQVQSQDDEITQAVVEYRRAVMRARIDWSTNWQSRSRELLAYRNIAMQAAFTAAQFNRDNAQAIREGREKAKKEPGPQEYRSMAQGDLTLQQLESNALLLPGQGMIQKAIIPIEGRAEDETHDAIEDERIKNAKVSILGQQGVPSKMIPELMSKWFDQLKDPDEPQQNPTEPTQADFEDQGEGDV